MAKNKASPEACGTCRFWLTRGGEPVGGDGRTYYGDCRYNPPVLAANDFMFPTVLNSKWCGKWELKVVE